MDKTRFTSGCTGRLVPIREPKPDWAFVPDPMPPKWKFPNELWPLLCDAKEALGTLNGIGQVLPTPELLCQPLQSREALTSSSLEGTHIEPEQLLLYEMNPEEPRSPNEAMSEWQEVANYRRALTEGFEMLARLPLCSRVIKAMHKTLMHGVRGAGKSPGEFRRRQNQIGSGGRFIPPPAEEAEALMSDLEKYMNAEEFEFDPLVRCYLVHYQFEAIHPFVDGNGRVGRLLLALMVYKWLGHSLPWLYMSAYFENYKEEYVNNMFSVSAKGDWAQWIEFCLRGTVVQAKDAIRRCHEFLALRRELHKQAESNCGPRATQIIESLFTSPFVAASALQRRYGVSYPTAKADIDRLLAAGILIQLPASRRKVYYSPAIFKIAYES